MYVCFQSLYCVQLFATSWTTVHQIPLSMGFSRGEYCSGLPLPPPRDLPNAGTEPASPGPPVLTARFFTTELPGKPQIHIYLYREPYIKPQDIFFYIFFFCSV